MKKPFVSTVITLLLLMVLASTTLAAPATGERQLLLKGSFEATETQQVVFPNAAIDATGVGNATHLGLFTYHLQATLHLPTLTASASATLEAADGSKLFVEGSGQGTPTSTPGVVAIVETFTITGGIGRFDGATGNVTVKRLLDRATLTSSGMITGNIVIP